MPRFIPPHLMALVTLLIIVLWFLLVHQFRRSAAMQKWFALAIGDDTPENALLAFEAAKLRLTSHLQDGHLDRRLRHRIEVALGSKPDCEAIDARTDHFSPGSDLVSF